MTLDQGLMISEIVLLIWITVQGEFVRYYEREVHRIQSDREKERKAWRLAKQKQALKKSETVAEVNNGIPKQSL